MKSLRVCDAPGVSSDTSRENRGGKLWGHFRAEDLPVGPPPDISTHTHGRMRTHKSLSVNTKYTERRNEHMNSAT